MVRYENDCVGCAVPGYPCRGSDCPLRNVAHYYCDECGAEEQLFEYDGQELCRDCLLEAVPSVEGSY
ncbi:MAG: hypothetical protein IJ300_12950 [Clostridia bacterium]|nr:hypothetical protein [Clostridia bacterium]